MPLYGVIAYLNAGQEIVGAVCSAMASNQIMTWRVAWLTGELLGFAEVSMLADAWTAESEDQVPSDSSAWARPLRDVVGLDTRLLNHPHVGAFGSRWAAGIYPAATFTDGMQLRLPLFDTLPGPREQKAVDTFAQALRRRVTI